MNVTYGRYTFKGRFKQTVSLERRPGVYVVSCNSGSKVVDVGESTDVRDRVENHNREGCWHRNRTGPLEYAARYCGASERKRIESELRKQYRPSCGDR